MVVSPPPSTTTRLPFMSTKSAGSFSRPITRLVLAIRKGSASYTPSTCSLSKPPCIDLYVPMPKKTASYLSIKSWNCMSLPISVLSTNSTPISVKIWRRSLITSFSNLKDGIPNVSRPPISSYLS